MLGWALSLTRKRPENETPENIRAAGVEVAPSPYTQPSHMSWIVIWILYITTRQLTKNSNLFVSWRQSAIGFNCGVRGN